MSTNQPSNGTKPLDMKLLSYVAAGLAVVIVFIYLAVRINQLNGELAAQKTETAKQVDAVKAEMRESVASAKRKAVQQIGAALVATMDPLLYQYKAGDSTLQDAVDRAATSGLFDLILVTDPGGKTIATSDRKFMTQVPEGILVDAEKISEDDSGITGTFPVMHGQSKMGYIRLRVKSN